MTEFRHDPFSRTSLGRELVQVGRHPFGPTPTCQWCGSAHKTPKGTYYLYRYWALSDGGSKAPFKGLFCNLSCLGSYHRV